MVIAKEHKLNWKVLESASVNFLGLNTFALIHTYKYIYIFLFLQTS